MDIFVGTDWEKAKTQCEVGSDTTPYISPVLKEVPLQCLDYLFEVGVKMKLAGLDLVLEGN